MQDIKYKKIVAQQDALLEVKTKTSSQLGYAKLVVFLFLVVAVIFTFVGGLIFLANLSLVLCLFVWLWVWHYRVDASISYAKGIREICTRHIARAAGDFKQLRGGGKALASSLHPYAHDLDIIGEGSLYRLLNTTHTWHGAQKFASDLLSPSYLPQDIRTRQQAIQELSQDINFTNDIEYKFMQVGAKELDIVALANAEPFVKSGIAKHVLCYAPLVTIGFFVASIVYAPLLTVGIVMLVLQVLICWLVAGGAKAYLQPVATHKLGGYMQVVRTITAGKFTSTGLQNLQAQLLQADIATRELDRIVSMLSFVGNPIIYFVLKYLLLWEFYAALLLQVWKNKYGHLCSGWFNALGEFESLVAFSHLPNVCEGTCLPQVVDDVHGIFDASGLGHPLLANDKRKLNEISLGGDIFIVSGSNMAGKTTFMRCVGINMLLARAGSFVCATSMRCSLFNIVTSMRIADDLSQGVSTFYAELARIKFILDTVKPGSIFFIDEIFKGTNSTDRIAGARAVVTKLAQQGATGMVSTHDLELCTLASISPRIRNISFCEHYRDGKIYFDYKLQNGQSKTTNAKFLMQMIGL